MAQHGLHTLSLLLLLLLLLVLLILQEAVSISAPGSIFAGNFLTAEGLGLLHSRSASTAATAGTDASRHESTPAAATAATNSKPASNTSADASNNSSSSRVRPSGLMSQFKWGCPDNVEQVRASFRTELPLDLSSCMFLGPHSCLCL
jgi:hypothetical protein